jgi:ATP-dependent RNA helicase DeaD
MLKSVNVHEMNNDLLQFREELQVALQNKNIISLSEVQRQCIPHACKGEDIFAQAPTGSGKTYAYLLPILERIEIQGKGKHSPQALILAPTRELCLQIAENVRGLLEKWEGIRTLVLTGGVDMNAQVRSSAKGADIVIGTPSRICDHLRRHTFKPKLCSMAVLDEADVMLSMGFREDVRAVLDSLPEHQTLLFSATYTKDVEALAQQVLRQPFHCRVEEEKLLEQDTEYFCYLIEEHAKLDLLKELLRATTGQVLLFCNTRKTADFVCHFLQENTIDADCIHSEMDPKKRKWIMKKFRENDLKILTATDVASRGIDIPAVGTVICYDMPDAMDDLIHRFGRTSRAGNHGTAHLFLRPEQKGRLQEIQNTFPALHIKKKEYTR